VRGVLLDENRGRAEVDEPRAPSIGGNSKEAHWETNYSTMRGAKETEKKGRAKITAIADLGSKKTNVNGVLV